MPDIDNNGNSYPSLYTRNVTNSPIHLQQVLQNLSDRHAGRLPPPLSVYFDKDLLDISVYNPWKYAIENRILPLMKHRTTLPVDSAATSPNYELVFVYDIEQITAISDNYRRELEVLLDHIDPREPYYLVEYVLQSLNISRAFELLSEQVSHIDDVLDAKTDALKEIAPKYEALIKMYNEVLNGFNRKISIISEDLFDKCRVEDMQDRLLIREAAEEFQKIYNQRWKTVDKCLKLVKKRSEKSTKKYANVVLSELGVAYGMSQLLLSSHAPMVPCENVYSTEVLSKAAVFEKVQSRFGEKCTLIYITSFPQRASIPAKLNIPIWHVTSNDSIRKLYKAQRDILLR